MKRVYERPLMTVELFEANEYVASCWGVSCSVNEANAYEQEHGYYDKGNVSHAADHCGFAGNQVIYDDNNDGVADRMVEVGTDGLGTLACTIYSDDNYQNQVSVGGVNVGDTIYWTTSATSGRPWQGSSSNKRVWHHVGTVVATVPGHPNRS